MTMTDRPLLSINSSAIPVAGIGGIGMLAVAGIIAVEFPLTRAIAVLGGLSGIFVGVALIVFRRLSMGRREI
jgi:hypothetical protein